MWKSHTLWTTGCPQVSAEPPHLPGSTVSRARGARGRTKGGRSAGLHPLNRPDLTPRGPGRMFFMLMPMILSAPECSVLGDASSAHEHSTAPHILGVCRMYFLTRPWSLK